MDGQDAIVTSMRRFANDAKCVQELKAFKDEAETKMAEYKKAMVLKMKADMSERALKQLQAIASFEASMAAAMQELVVREAAASFKETYPTNAAMQNKAFAAALKSLAGKPLEPGDDPVTGHFEAALKSLAGVDLITTKGDPKGNLAARLAFAQQAKEKEFQQSFMVSAAEAAEVKAIAAQAGPDVDVGKLPADAAKRLGQLYTSINAKVGYAMPDGVISKPIAATSDGAANGYVEAVNKQLAAAATKLQQARLAAFAKSFA